MCGAENVTTVPGGPPPGQTWGGGSAPSAHPAPAGQPGRLTGTQRAVLIGINYVGTRAQLRGCHTDVMSMRALLRSLGFEDSNIRVLMDDGRHENPTRANITAALHWLVRDARPGDVFFFHFSGHGAQQEDPQGLEEDGMNETILPTDFKRAGMITDDEISRVIVHPLPEGCKLTALLDSCHSGTGNAPPSCGKRVIRLQDSTCRSRGCVLDGGKTPTPTTRLPTSSSSPAAKTLEPRQTRATRTHDHLVGMSCVRRYGAPAGAMTTAFIDALRANPCPTYPELIAAMSQSLRRRGFQQRPQLSSTQRFTVDRSVSTLQRVTRGHS